RRCWPPIPRSPRSSSDPHADGSYGRSAGVALVNDLILTPKGWIEAFGEIVKFGGRMVRDVATLRVLRFFGEALRQAGILIVSSTLVIWGLVFVIGLECGIEGAYFTYGQGVPAYSGVFAAWCDLRELVPLVFGYMMAAKVGTGIV